MTTKTAKTLPPLFPDLRWYIQRLKLYYAVAIAIALGFVVFEIYATFPKVVTIGVLVAAALTIWTYLTESARKRVEDLFLASVFLLALAPMMLLIALMIKLDSTGPVLFSQVRLGLNGRQFVALKFRTMHVDVRLTPGRASSRDPRLTRIGFFLHRTSLDELPQLWNVLKGDMSVVGPRPYSLRYASMLERLGIQEAKDTYKVRPGITGWAQVHGLTTNEDAQQDIAKEDAQRDVAYDLYYIKQQSLMLDLLILLRALRALGGHRTADAMRV